MRPPLDCLLSWHTRRDALLFTHTHLYSSAVLGNEQSGADGREIGRRLIFHLVG